MGTVRIQTNGQIASRFWNVYLDDIEITKYLQKIEIRVSATQETEIWFKVVAKLDIPDEIKGLVTIYQEKVNQDVEAD